MAKRKKFEEEREFKMQPIVAKTLTQQRYLKALAQNSVVVATGSAGSGKTYIAASWASNRLKKGEINKIILTRPYVAMGRSSGFFPGTIEEKLEPYLKPMLQVIESRLGTNDYECLLRTGKIQMQPMEAIRGMSFEDCVVIIDESQNTTPDEMKSVTTRLGENCQLVVCGDPYQTDIKGMNGIDFLHEIVVRYNIQGAEIIQFQPEDVVRSGITAQFVRAYDDLINSKGGNDG